MKLIKVLWDLNVSSTAPEIYDPLIDKIYKPAIKSKGITYVFFQDITKSKGCILDST